VEKNANFIGHETTVAVAALMLVKFTARVAALYWAFRALRGVQMMMIIVIIILKALQ
jgi:hypothetical protein